MPEGPPTVQAASLLQTARFATSVAEAEQLNAAALAMVPEIAFVGRSNAGKSSTINVLAQQRQLAFASKTPGRTQLLNFFTLTRRDEAGQPQPVAYLVDLPGYGFARADEAVRERWDALVGGYLQQRRMLVAVVLVLDARRGLIEADEALLRWLEGRADPAALSLMLVLNKADQLSTAERKTVLKAVEARAATLPMRCHVQLFSALKREGIEALQRAVVATLPAATRRV